MSNNSSQDDLFDRLLTDFLDESGQLLDRLDQDLLNLDEIVAAAIDTDSEPATDPELLNTIFRSAHSLKGLSAMLGLSNINHLTHRLENVFDAARKKEMPLTRPMMEVTFRAHDALKTMIDQLSKGGDDSHDVVQLIDEIDGLLKLAGSARPVTTQQDAEAALQALLAENAASQGNLAATNPALAPVTVNIAELTAKMEQLFAEAVDETEVPAKYVAIFIDETDLSLDEIFDFLYDETKLAESETSESLLITMHRIKGSAASIGLNRPARLAHLAEDLLQELREHKRPLTPSLAEALSGVADALRNYVQGMRQNAADSSGFVAAAVGLLRQAAAKEVVATPVATTPSNPAAKTKEGNQTPFSWQPQVVAALQQHCDVNAQGWIGHVRFVAGLPLSGMKAQLLFDKLSRLGTISHTIPAALGLEDVEDLVDFYFSLPTQRTESEVRSELAIAGVEEVHLQRLGASVATIGAANSPLASSNAATTTITQPTVAKSGSFPAAAIERKAESAKLAAANSNNGDTGKPSETLRVDIERLDQLMNLAGQLVINKARFSQIGNGMKDVLPSKQTATWLNNAVVMAERAVNTLDTGLTESLDLDALRTQMRRLTTDLNSLKGEFSRLNGMRGKVNELYEAVHQLERVSGGIQKSVMDTRMVPIGPLFQRFKRVVRDVTRTNNKDVRLTIHGEKTELDKRMIDELGDPLIHMVRNSADHGIESPEARIAAGKSPQGEITLDAFHRGNSIVIQVRDDGKGLDQARILAKAIEREIITPADAERMTSFQIHQLVWEPGFSTADKVTEISGRGMGMDIVRSKIEALSGTVEVDSVPGQGATFTIKLPLTLAILPSLMSIIEGDTFAIPLESIVEIVRVKNQDIATIHGLPAARIRGRVVSVVELNDLFQWSQPARTTRPVRDDSTLIVIGHESEEIGLIVDHVVGEDDIVIKTLAENYKNVAGIAGASILGDGSVSLILDVAALVETAARVAPRVAS